MISRQQDVVAPPGPNAFWKPSLWTRRPFKRSVRRAARTLFYSSQRGRRRLKASPGCFLASCQNVSVRTGGRSGCPWRRANWVIRGGVMWGWWARRDWGAADGAEEGWWQFLPWESGGVQLGVSGGVGLIQGWLSERFSHPILGCERQARGGSVWLCGCGVWMTQREVNYKMDLQSFFSFTSVVKTVFTKPCFEMEMILPLSKVWPWPSWFFWRLGWSGTWWEAFVRAFRQDW